MSEGHVYLCQSKKLGKSITVWLEKHPNIKAAGKTLEDAIDNLRDQVCLVLGDGEAEFDLTPTSSEDNLVALLGNAFWYPQRTLTRADYELLYEGGLCNACCQGIGRRTQKPLPVGSLGEGDMLINMLRMPDILLASDRFRRLLHPSEEQMIEWIPIVLPARSRRTFFEVRAKSSIKTVVDRTKEISGWCCPKCGFRLYGDKFCATTWIAASDVPTPKPEFLIINDPHLLTLAISVARWKEIRGQPGTRNILTRKVVQLPKHRVWRRPTLKMLDQSWCAAINEEFETSLHPEKYYAALKLKLKLPD